METAGSAGGRDTDVLIVRAGRTAEALNETPEMYVCRWYRQQPDRRLSKCCSSPAD
jgi:hypothetical protein